MADRREQERRRRAEARELLREELTEVVGEQRAERAERRGALDEAIDESRARTLVDALRESRAVIAMTLFTALIVGALIALITGTWWFIVVALVLHAIGTLVVVGTTLSLASQQEKPDPSTAVALEARGVRDPDAALEHAVEVAEEDDADDERGPGGRGGAGGDAPRSG